MSKLNSSADSSSAELSFICVKCNQPSKTANGGCSYCASTFFRVARHGNVPVIESPLADPYRAHDTQEDGYKMNTPGDEGSISGSGLGQRWREPGPGNHEEAQNSYLPTDQDCFDRNTEPTQSPAMTADDSPFNPMNYKEPLHIGPFNMQKSPTLNTNRMNVFDRIRKTRKEK